MEPSLETRQGQNFAVAQIGPLENLKNHYFKHPLLPKEAPGKLFLKSLLGLGGMEVSLNRLPAGARMPFAHSHKRNEELYIFLRGSGQFQVDGEVIEVREGTVLRVSPKGARVWRNNSSNDLYYVCIQAREDAQLPPEIEDGVSIRRLVKWPD